jgi:exopolyphosphatase / guanosine-5'-triphosphate,3'-diphosphate pyrophosphatase
MSAAVEAAVRFRQRLDDLGISRYRAVATSAVRESRNGGELVEQMRREAGIHLETITGSEEARLVWIAVRHRIPYGRAPWLLADLGGGSIEISIVDRSGIRASESHPIGTVRLLEHLAGGWRDGQQFRRLIERYAARLRVPEGILDDLEGLVITGGNAEALGDLASGPPPAGGLTQITRGALQATLDELAAMTFDQRVRELGLREDRADVIVPAAIIFEQVARIANVDRILVPRVGVKDGLLYDLVADVTEHAAHETELDRTARTGAIALGRHYRFDERHALHVATLAASLFDQLQPLHGLDETSRRRLTVAAILHDIGQFVSYRRHHKHSWYLVMHAEIPGVSAEDLPIVALVTRYHRRSVPRPYHEGYAALSESERDEVGKLASLLRIADALDHEHQERVSGVAASIGRSRVVLELEATGDTLLAGWSVEKKSGLFEDVYGLKLELA